jgi:hypothetical protein
VEENMGGDEIRSALERARGFFAARETRAGLVGRGLLQASEPHDAELADHLIREIRRRTRLDGSMGGSLVDTAWAACELMDLGCLRDCAALVRIVGYLLSRQNAPGHYAEGCSEERHRDGCCHHALRGFFSPAVRDVEIAPLVFPTGVTVSDEEDARFAASCFALRAVLRAGEDRRNAVRDHASSLVASRCFRAPWERGTGPNLFFFALGALVHGPLADRPRVAELLEDAAARQTGDGTWPDTALFHALDTISGATAPQVHRIAVRLGPYLCAMQRPGGAFDATENEEWAVLAVRTLLLAGEMPA